MKKDLIDRVQESLKNARADPNIPFSTIKSKEGSIKMKYNELTSSIHKFYADESNSDKVKIQYFRDLVDEIENYIEELEKDINKRK